MEHTPLIAVVDYGLGNVQAFINLYRRLNIPAERVINPEELAKFDKIMLPGVGAFDKAMSRLIKSGMRDALEEQVVGLGKAILGICVGMQMLANSSEEGSLEGLGWIDGKVRKFESTCLDVRLAIPHMGWNSVTPIDGRGLFAHLQDDMRFYFLHSYYLEPADASYAIAMTRYGRDFACCVKKGNVLGVQFHPEKSHHWGIRLLKNFAHLD